MGLLPILKFVTNHDGAVRIRRLGLGVLVNATKFMVDVDGTNSEFVEAVVSRACDRLDGGSDFNV